MNKIKVLSPHAWCGAWMRGLEERYVAPMLSHQRMGGWTWRCRAHIEDRDFNQVILATAFARDLYSASVLERAIVALTQFIFIH
jgi:hypothetical protein